MVLRTVARLEAENGARVLQIAIPPAVFGYGEEDLEPERRRRRDAELDHPNDVALAAPDCVVARLDRPVLSLDAADPDADPGQAVPVGEVARDRFAPNLAGAVEDRKSTRLNS